MIDLKMIAPLVDRQIKNGDQFGQVLSVSIVGVESNMPTGLLDDARGGGKLLVDLNVLSDGGLGD
jgi:hypothetical protein